jgi:hypothetical protein
VVVVFLFALAAPIVNNKKKLPTCWPLVFYHPSFITHSLHNQHLNTQQGAHLITPLPPAKHGTPGSSSRHRRPPPSASSTTPSPPTSPPTPTFTNPCHCLRLHPSSLGRASFPQRTRHHLGSASQWCGDGPAQALLLFLLLVLPRFLL